MEGGSGFVVGMSCGFGAGFSSGIGAGMAAGRKKAREEISQYAMSNRLTLKDRRGKTVPIEQLFDAALGSGFGAAGSKKQMAVMAVILGVLVVAGLVLFLYLL